MWIVITVIIDIRYFSAVRYRFVFIMAAHWRYGVLQLQCFSLLKRLQKLISGPCCVGVQVQQGCFWNASANGRLFLHAVALIRTAYTW